MVIQYQNTLEDYREMTNGIAAVKRPVNGPIQIVILMLVFGTYYVVTRYLWQRAGDATGDMAGTNMWIAITAFGFMWLSISLPASFASRKFPWLTLRQFVSLGTFVLLIAALLFQHYMNRTMHRNGTADELNWKTLLPHSIWLVILMYAGAVGAHNFATATQRKWGQRLDLQRYQTVDISAEGIKFSDAAMRLDCQWTAFVKHEETRNLFLLFTSENNAIMIPKRAFGSGEELAAMRNILRLIEQSQSRGFSVLPLGPNSRGQAA